MIHSYRPSNLGNKHSTNQKHPKTGPSLSNTQKIRPSENIEDTTALMGKIREYEVKHLQFRNELLKKEIQLKERNQVIKDFEKELVALRREKEGFNRAKDKFDLQRKSRDEKIDALERHNEELTNRLESLQAPKDRYETCLRELDELKNNIDEKDNIVKQRDLYKYFHDQVKDLITSDQYTAEEVRSSLKSFFTEMSAMLTK